MPRTSASTLRPASSEAHLRLRRRRDHVRVGDDRAVGVDEEAGAAGRRAPRAHAHGDHARAGGRVDGADGPAALVGRGRAGHGGQGGRRGGVVAVQQRGAHGAGDQQHERGRDREDRPTPAAEGGTRRLARSRLLTGFVGGLLRGRLALDPDSGPQPALLLVTLPRLGPQAPGRGRTAASGVVGHVPKVGTRGQRSLRIPWEQPGSEGHQLHPVAGRAAHEAAR